MFLVSYFFPAHASLSNLEINSATTHPHRILNGGGSGGGNIYPDELWAVAKLRHEKIKAFAEQCQIKPTVRFEWKKGWPSQFLVCEGSFCSLDGHPEALSPADIPSDTNKREPLSVRAFR